MLLGERSQANNIDITFILHSSEKDNPGLTESIKTCLTSINQVLIISNEKELPCFKTKGLDF